mgnify:CR=1 FL=1
MPIFNWSNLMRSPKYQNRVNLKPKYCSLLQTPTKVTYHQMIQYPSEQHAHERPWVVIL